MARAKKPKAKVKAKAKASAKPKARPTAKPAVPFAFFGAGAATYYEQALLSVVFQTAPSRAVKQQLEKTVPDPLEPMRWTKRTLHLATDDYALVGWDSFDAFNAAIERWLHACHAIVPIAFAFRDEDSEAGTEYSSWHHASMTGVLDLISNLDERYDDDDTRDDVKQALLAMMKGAGIAVPDELDPVPSWRTALDAGDARTFCPLIASNVADIQLVLDVKNAMHRRAMLGGRPTLDSHGRFDGHIFQMALIDGGDDTSYVIDRMVARATKAPFWATSCAADAARVVKEAPESALSVLDRLVELDTSHAIVVENALWAAEELGPTNVSRERLERYWSIAVDKLAEWEELRPYLEKLAPVLGRAVPVRVEHDRARKRRR